MPRSLTQALGRMGAEGDLRASGEQEGAGSGTWAEVEPGLDPGKRLGSHCAAFLTSSRLELLGRCC